MSTYWLMILKGVFFFSFWSNKGIMVMLKKNIQVYKYCIWASKFALYRGMG